MIKAFLFVSAVLLSSIPIAVAASPTATITFTGTVVGDPGSTIQVRQADGTSIAYTGTAPAMAYQVGQAVTITMNATLPDASYFKSWASQPTDGLYHFRLASDGVTSQQGGTLSVGSISGGLSQTASQGEPGSTSISLIYNANSGIYTVDPAGSFSESPVVGAGYRYDSASAVLKPCTSNCVAQPQDGNGGYALRSSGESGSITSWASNILDSLDNIWGSFTLKVGGSWNVSSTSGATSVPEPSMLALFGPGVLMLVWRRRRRAARP